MEIELKLLVNAQGRKTLRQHPLIRKYSIGETQEEKISDTYFDTPDLQIRRSDAGLRVRRVNNGWIQTLKAGGSVNAGLHSRHEWESEIGGPAPEFLALQKIIGKKTPWTKLVRSSKVEARVIPIFTTSVKRTVWQLRLPCGDEVECVLDVGTIERNDQNVPISEIELELKSGDPSQLFEFALELLQDIPFQIGNHSKADRGYALYTSSQHVISNPERLSITKRMTIEEAFQASVTHCIAQIQANAANLGEVDAAESLHQMRIGLRRLHIALGLFNSVIRVPKNLLQEMDWLATQLAAARDWDVLVGLTLPAIAKAMPDEARLEVVRTAASEKAYEKHKIAAAAVNSPRFTRLILFFTSWILSRGWQTVMPPVENAGLLAPVRKFIRPVLKYQQRRLLKRGQKLSGATPETRHRFRIAAKNTRYATEFFQSLYTPKSFKPFVSALSELQNELGRLNDTTVAFKLLEELSDGQFPWDGGTTFIRTHLLSETKKDGRKIRKLWKKFRKKSQLTMITSRI
jgi:triphosphatase